MLVPNLLPPGFLLVGHVLLLHLVAVPPHVLVAFRRDLKYVSWSESYTVLRCHDGNWWALAYSMQFGPWGIVAVKILLPLTPFLLPAASLPIERLVPTMTCPNLRTAVDWPW